MPAERRLALLAGVACAAAFVFMVVGLRGDLALVLELRGIRLLALATVAVAVAVATVLFQTASGNALLTPSVLGLDALFGLTQTVAVVVFGGLGYAALDPLWMFAAQAAAMMVFSLGLVLPLLHRRSEAGRLLLTGVVLGVLLNSLSQLLARWIDPTDQAILQRATVADFGAPRTELVGVALAVTVPVSIFAWRRRAVLDVVGLGEDRGTALGLDWRPTIAATMALSALLVAVATALVGPVAFFGLLVASLGERVVGTRRHALLLPAAALAALVLLVGGQTVFQHLVEGAGTLGVVLDFAGGLVFLALLMRQVAR